MQFIDSPNRTDTLEQLLKTREELLKLNQCDASILFALRICNQYINAKQEEIAKSSQNNDDKSRQNS